MSATRATSPSESSRSRIGRLKLAFHAGRELTTEQVLAAVPEVRPLSQTDSERVAAITEWLERHAKPAGHPKTKDTN